MTYCLALKMNEGMVFASDSRTNAGVDQIASFKKMRTYNNGTDRVIVTLTSGNLSITQSVVNLIEQRASDPDVANIWNAKTLFDVATLFGECLREVRKETAAYLDQTKVDMGVNFIVGGQVAGEPQRLFLIYSEGNFIEATEETPFFQIGETKYGKPVLDRFMQPETTLVNAIKCALVSLDSTVRSNISVGLPIDLVSVKPNHFEFNSQYHITEDDAYFSHISTSWREGLTTLFDGLPAPEGFDDNTKVMRANESDKPLGTPVGQAAAPASEVAEEPQNSPSLAQHQSTPATSLMHAAQNNLPAQHSPTVAPNQQNTQNSPVSANNTITAGNTNR
ncbi:peptidase [Alteromonas gilva]|uniref:Peptidase n=1 Tax=Alteromonas gilva TaxID=2987522 RepID=A0ABT5KZN4_9ALTE|nr:peptidase [Alteromonas gilva]MDC8830234.1 peptidase [Alteromonas gilva]